MTYSGDGLQLTENFEGCKLVAYQDIKGVWTIGYGHTRGVYSGQTITQEQAAELLREDIQEASAAVNRLVAVQLTQSEFDALVDFVFNVGETAFANSTMLRRLNVRNYAAAADEFERWDMCGGQHVAGLLRRRLAEKAEFLSETA